MATDLPPQFQLATRPVADPAAVVPAGLARFTVLTDRLLRLEYAPDGRFEDRASQAFWYRQQPVPTFTVAPTDDGLSILTAHLQLVYRGGAFNQDSLSISLTADGAAWRPGQADTGNLRGTYRTLDQLSGGRPLEPGLLSRDGWVVVDDSASLVFDESGWLQPRQAHEKYQDLYFFGYGHDYRRCLQDYCRLTGPVPPLPRWALGNWWSRYWEYTQTELMSLMRDFQEHDIPLSVCIVDMDWHLTDTGGRGNGWTGYTWNRDLFPDPAGFVAWLHEQRLRTALNLHPALGVRAHERQYTAMARRLGIDPATEQPIPFDAADPAFIQAYFEELHHPEEEETGVDFWWMDWQQGTETKLTGLDPLWWLNHLHFYDLGRDGVTRPFIFSRWGGLGNHRYPIGFSGDTYVDWASLAFQPYFTAAAANVAYGWWSHDIGGHMFGREDPELYRRWVQYGVFSPILRLHSTKNPIHERRPWGYDAETLAITRRALQLRHRLVPYLYSESWLFAQTSLPPIRPMYHDHPEREEAYHCPRQYTFGSQLLAAPYVTAADPDTRLSRQVVWLPPGDWYDFFSGAHYAGDAWHALYGGPEDIPVFAPAGAILPLAKSTVVDELPVTLELRCFAGQSGEFTLYEDDGTTTAYQSGARAETTFRQEWSATGLTITIAAATGDHDLLPALRSYTLYVFGIPEPSGALLSELEDNGDGPPPEYNFARRCFVIEDVQLRPHETLTLHLDWPAAEPAPDNRLARAEQALAAFNMDTAAKASLQRRLPEVAQDPAGLVSYLPRLTPSQRRALLEILTGAGVTEIKDTDVPFRYVIWNNENRPDVRCQYARNDDWQWDDTGRFAGAGGAAPRFQAITLNTGPDTRLNWEVRVDYLGLTHVTYEGRWQ